MGVREFLFAGLSVILVSGTACSSSVQNQDPEVPVWFFFAMIEKVGNFKANVGPKWVNGLSRDCRDDVQAFLDGLDLTKPKLWALQMLDAFGMMGSGMALGNTKWIGSYSECVRIEVKQGQRTLWGKHCMAQRNFGPYADNGFGVCFPRSCSSKQVEALLNANLTLYPNIQYAVWCTEPPVLSQHPAAVAFIVVTCILALLVAAATVFQNLQRGKKQSEKKNKENAVVNKGFVLNMEVVTPASNASKENGLSISDIKQETETSLSSGAKGTAAHQHVLSPESGAAENVVPEDIKGNSFDLVTEKKEKRYNLYDVIRGNDVDSRGHMCKGILRNMLLSFSLSKNAPVVADSKHPPGSFACLDGIRFLSMAWIVLGHSWQLGLTLTPSKSAVNANDLPEKYHKQFLHQTIHHMNLAVESFFLMGGMLVTVTFFKGMKRIDGSLKKAFSSLPCFYFHRYWRLTPAYAYLLWMWTSIFPLVGLGPLHLPNVYSDQCQANWWTHLLYIHNFIQDKDCFGWGWYLAVDFQLYIVAPFVLIILYKSRKAGLVTLSLLMVGTVVANLVIWHFIVTGALNVWISEYTKPWTRAGPYIIGIFVGYLYNETKFKIKMKKWFVIVGWIVAVILTAVPVFLSYMYRCPSCSPPNAVATHVFYALHRNVFALGLAWIVIACCSGYGGFINSMLSSRYFVPLSKLSYLSYLIHPMILYYTIYQADVMIGVSIWTMLYHFLGTMVLSLFGAWVVTLLIEVPMLNLKGVLLPRVMS